MFGGNAMKLKKKALIAGIALATAATVLLVLLPMSANLWVAYLSCVSGAAMLLAGAFAVANRKIPGGRARLLRIAWFLPVSLVISVAVLVLKYTGTFELPFEMHVVLQLAPLAVGAVKLLGIGEEKPPKKKPETEAAKEKKTEKPEADAAKEADAAPEKAKENKDDLPQDAPAAAEAESEEN